ncbi:MAG: phosphoribosylanthranilate isomerase [Clostridiales bacterium]|jgi:phosphoribosylanthranilate isomerase|nr:phosphoribosylanthranilate isomerase [Clostridiales bacterium]
MIKIKICGLFRQEDIDYVNEAIPDYVGFVFAKTSKRYVSLQFAKELSAKLRKSITPVGVFMNASANDIISICNMGIVRVLQLHGENQPAVIKTLRDRSVDLPAIRAVSIAPGWDTGNGLSLFDYYLLDNGAGGTGKAFDWSLIGAPRKPFFLAGGLNINNLCDALALNPYAVDISSGAESDNVKDFAKIQQLVKTVRRYNEDR